MYSSQVLDHFQSPRNMGDLPDANGVGWAGDPAHGDVMKLQLKIALVNGMETIVDVKAKIFGCGAAVASTSYLTEHIKGRLVAEAARITNKSIALALALPPVKVHCSVLAEEALKAALNDYQKRMAAETIPGVPASPTF